MTLRHTSFVCFWFRLLTLVLFQGTIIKLKQNPTNSILQIYFLHISLSSYGFHSWCLNLEAIAHDNTPP